MIGHAGEEVTVLYDEEDLSTITVILKGRTLCEASVHERMQMVGEDPGGGGGAPGKAEGIRQGRGGADQAGQPVPVALEVDEKRSPGDPTRRWNTRRRPGP